MPRRYCVCCPRDGERPGYHNVSLTVKRDNPGLCSNYLCDLKKGDKVVTIGGMHASVNAVSEKTVSLKLSEGVFVKYDKSAIATVLTAKADAEEKKEDK